jgi:hypothetical protein
MESGHVRGVGSLNGNQDGVAKTVMVEARERFQILDERLTATLLQGMDKFLQSFLRSLLGFFAIHGLDPPNE